LVQGTSVVNVVNSVVDQTQLLEIAPSVLNDLNITSGSTYVNFYSNITAYGNTTFNAAASYINNSGAQRLIAHGNVTLTNLNGGAIGMTFAGANTQTISRAAGTWPSGSVIVNKTGGAVQQTSNIAFTNAGQDMTMTAGTWNTQGYNLTIADTLTMAAGTVINKGCGSLTVNGVNVPAGAYGSGTVVGGSIAPNITVGDASMLEGSGAGTLNFVVTTDAPYCGNLTIPYATANGSATAGSDYTSTSGTLTLSSGATIGTISVPISRDATQEVS
jgi:hypothetical protein